MDFNGMEEIKSKVIGSILGRGVKEEERVKVGSQIYGLGNHG